MSTSTPVKVQYYSDVLCVWAYVGQARLDQLEAELGGDVLVEERFIDVFGDARDRLAARWADRGGLAGYAAHARETVARFGHVSMHADAWERVAPTSSLGCHLFLAAVWRVDRALCRRAAWALREAFFRDAEDVSMRAVQLAVAERLGLPVAAVEEELATGRAHAEHARGLAAAKAHAVEVSPTYVFNEGRQRLIGNVGYRVIEANVRELLRGHEGGHSWC
jgi:predicted DsbA family dithiol-disulfide isomerase